MKTVSIGFCVSAGDATFMLLLTPFDWGIWFKRMSHPIVGAYCRFGPLFFAAHNNYEGPIS